MLERDGLVVEKKPGPSRGPPSQTWEFSASRLEADKLFPQAYDRRQGCGAVLREVREQFGAPAVDRIFDGLSKRAIEKAQRAITAEQPEQRVAQLTEMLRESGVVAEYSLIDGGFALHEHSCPYSTVAKEHPEMCQVIHHVIEEDDRRAEADRVR